MVDNAPILIIVPPRTAAKREAEEDWGPVGGPSIAAPRRPRPRTTRRAGGSRADFCYLTRSPNNTPVRIVDHVSVRSAAWLARSEGFEPPTPRFEVWYPLKPAQATLEIFQKSP